MRRKGQMIGGRMKEVTMTTVGKQKRDHAAITVVGMTGTEGVGEIAAETGEEGLEAEVMGVIVVREPDHDLVASHSYCRSK